MKKLLVITVLIFAASAAVSGQTKILPNPPVFKAAEKPVGETDGSKDPGSVLLKKQQPDPYVRPTAGQRFKRYLNRTAGTGLIGVGIGATIQQIAEVPPEWEKNGRGFARRFASNFGENAIQETVAYGIEESLKLDSKFYKSKKRDFGSRLKNGLLSGITARTPTGKRVFNPGPIVGAYTANLISTQVWYPQRYSYKDGLRQGTQSIGFSIGFGLLNEFLFKRK